MPLTNAGRNVMTSLLTGASAIHFDNTNSHIGIGDSTTAFSVVQTDLQAATNKYRKSMDGGYPITSANTITFQSTLGPSVGNFAWNEWGVFNAASGGSMLNRVVEYNGTKLSGQTWVMQVDLTITVA